METSFIHMQILVHLHVNKTNFHMKVFALGLALKQRRKATRKSPSVSKKGYCLLTGTYGIFILTEGRGGWQDYFI